MLLLIILCIILHLKMVSKSFQSLLTHCRQIQSICYRLVIVDSNGLSKGIHLHNFVTLSILSLRIFVVWSNFDNLRKMVNMKLTFWSKHTIYAPYRTSFMFTSAKTDSVARYRRKVNKKCLIHMAKVSRKKLLKEPWKRLQDRTHWITCKKANRLKMLEDLSKGCKAETLNWEQNTLSMVHWTYVHFKCNLINDSKALTNIHSECMNRQTEYIITTCLPSEAWNKEIQCLSSWLVWVLLILYEFWKVVQLQTNILRSTTEVCFHIIGFNTYGFKVFQGQLKFSKRHISWSSSIIGLKINKKGDFKVIFIHSAFQKYEYFNILHENTKRCMQYLFHNHYY